MFHIRKGKRRRLLADALPLLRFRAFVSC